MEVTRQAGALGAIVTGVDIADVDDATFDALHDALLEHLVLCIKGQAHATPDDQVAFTARWGRIEPHPYVPPIEGHPEIIEIYDPNPITVTWHADFTYAKQPPSVSLLLGRIIPPVRRRHHVLERLPRLRGPLRRAARHGRRTCARCTTRRSSPSTAACPRTRSSTRIPVVCTHPETGRRALFVNDNYTRHFDGWSVDDSQPLLDHLYAQFAKPEYTWRHRWAGGRPPHLGQPLRAALGGRRHRRRRTLTAPHHHRRRHPDMTDIPWIVSLDDHVVEPPDVWTTRLPAKYRDIGPHVVMAPAGHADPRRRHATARRPGTDGPDVAWWFYEDQQYSVKRLIAAAGYPPDEIGFDGITFDEMRPGCWQPQARLDDMTMNHVEASLVLPELPALLRPDLPARRRTRSSPKLCVEAYNDWLVDEWCAGSNGRLIPLCLVPLWDAELAAAEVRRNAARGVRAVAFSELPAVARAPEHPLRLLGPVLRTRAPRPAPCVAHAHRLGHQDDHARRDDAPDAVQATNIFANSALSLIDFLFSGVLVRYPDLKLLYAEAQIGWIPYVLERVDDVWETHRGWSHSQTHVRRAAVAPTTTARSRAASSRTASASRSSTASGATTSRSRPTTRTRTAPGPTRTRWPRSCSATSTPTTVHKIVRGNAIRFLGLEGLGDGSGPRPVVTTRSRGDDRRRRRAAHATRTAARRARRARRAGGDRSPTTWSRPTCAASTRTART